MTPDRSASQAPILAQALRHDAPPQDGLLETRSTHIGPLRSQPTTAFQWYRSCPDPGGARLWLARDPTRNGRERNNLWAYSSMGWFFFGLGVLGTVAPGLPTTPFVLVALRCFSQSTGLRVGGESQPSTSIQ